MLPRTRFALGIALFAATSAPLAAEPVAFGSGGFATQVEGSTRLPGILRNARRHVADRDWDNAAHALQSLLTAPDGALLRADTALPDGTTAVAWQSPAAAANELLAKLPQEGLQVYLKHYGGAGAAALQRAANDPAALALVAARYRYTDAGFDALAALAAAQERSGDRLRAALFSRGLLTHPRAASLTPGQLVLVAARLRRAGDGSAAEAAWGRIQAAAMKGEVLLDDGRKLALDALRKELDKVAPLAKDSGDWALFRGGPTRAAAAPAGKPDIKRLWQDETDVALEDPGRQVKIWLDRADKARGRAAGVPGFHPLAAGGLVIYRGCAGVNAVALDAVKDAQGNVEAAAGEVLWKSVELDGSVAMLLGDLPRLRADVNVWLKAHEKAGRLADVLHGGGMAGALSADGRHVYAIDDLAVPPPPEVLRTLPEKPPANKDTLGPLLQNGLDAYILSSGKLAWRRGGAALRDDEFARTHWLGPPLPLGGMLYALNETNRGELRLVVLEPERGKVVSLRTLGTVEHRYLRDLLRRTQPVHLAYADGLLICPTHAGAVLAVDLATQELAWAFTYHAADERMEWRASAPLVHEGKVLLASADGAGLHCLSLRDGTPLWHAERGEGVYVAGVFAGRVLVVGEKSCWALALDGGKEGWRVETGAPAGLGAGAGNLYYLPLRSDDKRAAAVGVLDVAKGRLVERVEFGQGDEPGNLVFHRGRLVSQTASRIAAFALGKQ